MLPTLSSNHPPPRIAPRQAGSISALGLLNRLVCLGSFKDKLVGAWDMMVFPP